MKLKIDEAKWRDNDVAFSQSNGVYTFTVSRPPRPDLVANAVASGDTLDLYPDRSAAHAALRAMLEALPDG